MTWLYRYSEWDGSQEVPPLDPDELLSAISDDLMNFGDLQHALRNLLQRGLRGSQGQRLQGLRDLLQRLRQQRRQMLERYDLSSLFQDLERRLEEVLRLERETLDRRLDEAQRQLQGAPSALQPFQDAFQGQQNQAGEEQAGDDEERRRLAEMLRNIAQRKKDYLDNLPQDVPGRIKSLQEYEFMDPEAGAKFQELLEMLRRAMLDSFFKDLYNQIANMTPEDLQRLKDMVRALNQMLSEKMAGGEPDFQSFMQRFGDLFGPNPPQSLDELVQQMQHQMAAMQSLLDSLPPEMRRQLQELLMEKVADPELMRQLQELAINLDILQPWRNLQNQYPFRGDEEVDLLQAMQLMEHMQGLDELEHQLERTQYGGSLDDVDEEKLRELLGEEAYQTFRQLKEMLEILEKAGYIRRRGDEWELTPRAIRMIGQKALGEIYAQLRKWGQGKHAIRERGPGLERAEDVKKYEFGDPFHLHLGQTVFNAILREGPQVPVHLAKEDFEVYSTEHLTTTATVMMLDLSWSMALRGSFQAAKKVALALYNLIKTQFPRDVLYILGFSAYARQLKPEELPYVRWDESVLGTNMHHALILAQQLLAKHRTGTRQVIMISDGEPTAHLEHGRSYFSYPPSPVTIRKTLQEVKRCTQKGIIINTFMLDRNYYLKEFVNQIAKMNKGRVFYTTPEMLGQYILVDYVAQKRKRLRGS
ncbi:hypothetical protein HRbin25_00780 [bacterium HR25]|jgi:uncharacterized protein with von Willebrand factor type A (vWA) domain|nr:hypothetical protein HRbin25_00780 [bacterium HR25]